MYRDNFSKRRRGRAEALPRLGLGDPLAADGHVVIRIRRELEPPELARGCESLDVTLYQRLRTTVHLWVCSRSDYFLVHAQTPDVQCIIVGEGGDTRSKVVIVRGSTLTTIKSVVGLLERVLDLLERLASENNVPTTSLAVSRNIGSLHERQGFQRTKEGVFPRDRPVDSVMSNLARLLGLIAANVNKASLWSNSRRINQIGRNSAPLIRASTELDCPMISYSITETNLVK